ncbi:MAG: hypothetical protein ACUVQ8_03370 [Nitrososphaeria archaeon]
MPFTLECSKMMGSSRRYLSVIVLLLIAFSPLVAYAAPAKQRTGVQDKGGLKVIYSGLIGVAIPSNNTKPMFFWWSQEDNSTVYWMKYQGLEESWFSFGQFKHELTFKDDKDYVEQFKKIFENTSLVQDRDRLRTLAERTQAIGQLIRGLSVDSKDMNVTSLVDKVDALVRNIKSWPDSDAKDEVLKGLESLEGKLTEFMEASDHGKQRDLPILNKILREIFDLVDDISKKVANRLEKAEQFAAGNFKPSHPFYFAFDKGVWSLEGPTDIKIGDKIIGVGFFWKLIDVPDPKWSFLEGTVEIRNRLYFQTVEEKVNNTLLNLTRAELKSDLIIRRWEWNFNVFYKTFVGNATSTLAPAEDSFAVKPYLSLSIHFTAVKSSSKMYDDIIKLSDKGEPEEVEALEIVEGQGKPKIKLGDTEDVDLKLKETKIVGHARLLPGLMLAKNQTVGGFFRFVPNATVAYPNVKSLLEATKQLNVRGFFWPAGKQVKAFLLYPYFGDGIIEHDPSIGIISSQSESEIEELGAKVTVAGSTISANPVTSKPKPLVSPTLVPSSVLVGMVIITVVCIIAVAFSRKKKIEVLS